MPGEMQDGAWVRESCLSSPFRVSEKMTGHGQDPVGSTKSCSKAGSPHGVKGSTWPERKLP